MLEIEGKYGKAKIFTDLVEDAALDQVRMLMDCPFIEGQQVRMMPDIHAGAGCTIGTTIKLNKKQVCPNLVGVDIGCGMLASFTWEKMDLKKLDEVIHERIPSGFSLRKKPHDRAFEIPLDDFIAPINMEKALLSCGSLGGGNHFIEVDNANTEDAYAIVIHSGSRHLGVEVADYYQNKAIEQCKKDVDLERRRKEIIDIYKSTGREKEIGGAIMALKSDKPKIPNELCYVSDELYDDYIHDMKLAQQFASFNREIMLSEIMEGMGLEYEFIIESVHNYIDMYDMVLRKGATLARKGVSLLIPMNMRDGTLLCKGKGNEDWNRSAPHGAGRLMGRNAAIKSISLDEYVESMKDVYSTTVNERTLDEAPQAYKPMESIINNIGDTAEIISIMTPIYNFKADSQEQIYRKARQ